MPHQLSPACWISSLEEWHDFHTRSGPSAQGAKISRLLTSVQSMSVSSKGSYKRHNASWSNLEEARQLTCCSRTVLSPSKVWKMSWSDLHIPNLFTAA